MRGHLRGAPHPRCGSAAARLQPWLATPLEQAPVWVTWRCRSWPPSVVCEQWDTTPSQLAETVRCVCGERRTERGEGFRPQSTKGNLLTPRECSCAGALACNLATRGVAQDRRGAAARGVCAPKTYACALSGKETHLAERRRRRLSHRPACCSVAGRRAAHRAGGGGCACCVGWLAQQGRARLCWRLPSLARGPSRRVARLARRRAASAEHGAWRTQLGARGPLLISQR